MLNVILNTLILAISFIVGLPITVFFIECIAALLPNRSPVNYDSILRPKVSILIPAYNEALCIGATISAIIPELTDQDSIIVVADNCTDETGAIARQQGAKVLERIDPLHRGKGYALDYGLQFMQSSPPEVVVVIDADCIVHQGAIDRLARMAVNSDRPIQANYLLAPPANLTPKNTASILAFIVKNLVRLLGLQRLGLPASLNGTGMAFPWAVINNATVASDNIVEDKQLGLDLSIAGYPPLFCEEALVTQESPQQEQAAKTQKTRWVHGHLQTMLTQIPRFLWASVRQRRFDLFAIALDLSIPPFTLLILMWLVVMGTALLSSTILAVSWTPTIFLAIQGVLIFIAIISAWLKFGRHHLPLRMLLKIPVYILWHIPIFWSFLVRPQKAWIRTERDV